MNYIASWAGDDNPMGSILCIFFHDFIHAGAGAGNSNGVNLSIIGSYYHSEHLLKFRKDCFEL